MPLQSMVIGTEPKFYTLYLPNTGLNLKQIDENLAAVRAAFDDDVCVNDFKAHLNAFGLPRVLGYPVYELNLPKLQIKPPNEQIGRKILIKIAKEVVGNEALPWQMLLANAAVVYQALEDVGVKNFVRREHPHYHLDKYTGRSSTTGYNIQGTTDKDDIRPVTDNYDFFVQFDWIAADIRMAAHISQDTDMIASFNKSDPYTKIEQFLNDPEFTRERCKTNFLQALYSLRVDDPALMAYPQFQQWMRKRLEFMRTNGYLDSILGRRFNVIGNNQLSVFNAQFQASVAHAMHAAMIKIYEKYPHNLFTEIHDGIVMFGRERIMDTMIKDVVPIVLEPLLGWVKNPPIMPVRVSIGSKWRRWKPFKVYRSKQR